MHDLFAMKELKRNDLWAIVSITGRLLLSDKEKVKAGESTKTDRIIFILALGRNDISRDALLLRRCGSIVKSDPLRDTWYKIQGPCVNQMKSPWLYSAQLPHMIIIEVYLPTKKRRSTIPAMTDTILNRYK